MTEDTRWVWEDGAHIPRCHWHFHRRLYARYSKLVLEPGQFSYIKKQIREGTALLVGTDTYAVRVRRKKHKQWIYVVHTNDLVTAYGPKSSRKNRRIAEEDKRSSATPTAEAFTPRGEAA